MGLEEVFELEKQVYSEAIKNGVFKETRNYLDACRSCKPYIESVGYEDCMIQKYNSVYEGIVVPKIRQRYLK